MTAFEAEMALTEWHARTLDWLRRIRVVELDLVSASFPPGARVLEIGGGAGWQARRLAELGFEVTSIDVAGSDYARAREWPVTVYDGHCVPLADASVDVVFTSNVLEHVPHVRAFQAEIQRVLAPRGRAFHLLPTPSWRLWHTLAMYPAGARKLADRGYAASPESGVIDAPRIDAVRRWAWFARNNLVPRRHGAIGNSFSELHLFSRRRWVKLFEETGWTVERVEGNRLFYTGEFLLGGASLETRRRLATVLGSSCLLYVLTRREETRSTGVASHAHASGARVAP